MMIPELSGYLSGLGGADYKGLIIALFTLTAMISRPYSGKLSDTIGRILLCFLVRQFVLFVA
jgi:MFS family permease